MSVSESTFTTNSATDKGGAAYGEGSFVNCTFQNNSAGLGGAAYGHGSFISTSRESESDTLHEDKSIRSTKPDLNWLEEIGPPSLDIPVDPPSDPIKYIISVNSDLDNSTFDGAGTYDKDSPVKITATPPHDGYLFIGWSLPEDWGFNLNDANPLEIIADSDKIITAHFKKDNRDSDDDGISNYDEIERGLNPDLSDKAVIDAVTELKAMKAENVTPIVSGWYYVPNQGWLWTNKDVYPYTYSAEDKAWMYFQSGNAKPKFYRYKTKTWLTVE